uniref:Uncharacterized protein n=1 Tax=Magallana gigas TaxID=29159 RepID=A0A8W8K7N3_MAGGI
MCQEFHDEIIGNFLDKEAQVLDFPGRHAPVLIGPAVSRGPYSCPSIYCTLDNRNCRNPLFPCWSLRRPISFASCDCLPIILPPRGVAGK